jgi:hypothetical protein
MAVTKKAAEAYALMRRSKNVYDYYKLVRQALDEDTRSGALLRGGIKVSMQVAKKTLGSTVTWHPYFTYHKAHLELLSRALDAANMKEMATNAFNSAVAAADSTSSVDTALGAFKHRQHALDWEWAWTLKELINLQARYRVAPADAILEIRDIGLTADTLNSKIADTLYSWQARWAELCKDCLELYLMVDAEVRIAEAAMKRYTDKVTKLTSGASSIGRIAGYAAEQDRQWELYERMTTNSPQKSAQAATDPAGYAKRQLNAVDVLARRLCSSCDVVLGSAVNSPDTLLEKIHAIMTG